MPDCCAKTYKEESTVVIYVFLLFYRVIFSLGHAGLSREFPNDTTLETLDRKTSVIVLPQ